MIMDKYKRLASSSTPGYRIFKQLKQTTTQISFFELLKISFAHIEILDKTLLTTNVPKYLDVDQFQFMVGHLTLPHYITFPLSYNILLGRPWIHKMQAIPSIYLQWLKFPYNGVEVSIHVDTS